MGGMAWNLMCWCRLTTFRTDLILILFCWFCSFLSCLLHGFMPNLTGLWQLMGAAAIRSLNLLVSWIHCIFYSWHHSFTPVITVPFINYNQTYVKPPTCANHLWFRNIIHIGFKCLRYYYTPAQRSWRGGILDSPCPSVRPSVRLSVCPSVCRRHGFRSISQVCFGISISNFICMLMVAIGRSLLIFSDVTFKMAAWRPYWIFWFPDSNFTLALNINFKLQRHNNYVYG